MRRLSVIALVGLLPFAAGCATRVWGGVYTDDGGESDSGPAPTDGPAVVDIAQPQVDIGGATPVDFSLGDLTRPPTIDLWQPPPSVDLWQPPMTVDLSIPPTADLGVPPTVDLGVPPIDAGGPPVDLAMKSCGDIIRCYIQTNNLGACFQGASGPAIMESVALFSCAAQNCLRSDGGMGGGGTFQCVLQKCSAQVNACTGLF